MEQNRSVRGHENLYVQPLTDQRKFPPIPLTHISHISRGQAEHLGVTASRTSDGGNIKDERKRNATRQDDGATQPWMEQCLHLEGSYYGMTESEHSAILR